MKLSDLQLNPMWVLLGIFNQPTYKELSPNLLGYCKFEPIYGNPYTSVMEDVEKACRASEKIIFVLDGVKFPIDVSVSVTCQELRLICENNDLFSKTVFVRGENIIEFDKNLVL